MWTQMLGEQAWLTEFKEAAFDKQGVATVLGKGSSFFIPLNWIVSVVGIVSEGGVNLVVGEMPELLGLHRKTLVSWVRVAGSLPQDDGAA